MKTKIIIASIVFLFAVAPEKSFGASTAWSNVSGPGGKNGFVSSAKGAEPDIRVGDSGRVYAAFQEGSKNRARIREFNGQKWTDLADRNDPQGMISSKKGANPVLETKDGEVFAAFSDWANGKKVRVRKWSGSAWSDLADANHPSGLASSLEGAEPKLAFDKDKNFLYLGFRDEAGGQKIKIMRWREDIGWEDVAQNFPGGLISAGIGREVDIIADKYSDDMFVAFEDASFGNRIRVKKWNGAGWENLADAGYPDGLVGSQAGFSPSLAEGGDGTLFLVYHGLNGKNTFAYQWNRTTWSVLGSEVVVRDTTIESRAAADERNFLYVAYSYKSKRKWNVAAKIWNGSAWIDAKAGKSQNIARGKGNPALSVFGNRLYMCVAEGINAKKSKARVKTLNFNP